MRECILAGFGELEFCLVLSRFVIFRIIIIAIFYFPFTFSLCIVIISSVFQFPDGLVHLMVCIIICLIMV